MPADKPPPGATLPVRRCSEGDSRRDRGVAPGVWARHAEDPLDRGPALQWCSALARELLKLTQGKQTRYWLKALGYVMEALRLGNAPFAWQLKILDRAASAVNLPPLRIIPRQ